FAGGNTRLGFVKNIDDLFVGKTLLHGVVLMWLMKTLLTSRCINQRGAGHKDLYRLDVPHLNPLETNINHHTKMKYSFMNSQIK
ncbi:hypothetical protein, partial [Pectobacterium brasiliense]|uniref:hypothetical protein n=1 Tax=Pectobacterium brasiliense TaxID=180957 RepID=UPI0005803D3C